MGIPSRDGPDFWFVDDSRRAQDVSESHNGFRVVKFREALSVGGCMGQVADRYASAIIVPSKPDCSVILCQVAKLRLQCIKYECIDF